MTREIKFYFTKYSAEYSFPIKETTEDHGNAKNMEIK